MKSLHSIFVSTLLLLGSQAAFGLKTELVNVSYDPTRELFEKINPAFIEQWESQGNQDLTIQQLHGSSGQQSQAVVDGLKADVVTLALAPDIDLLVKNELVDPSWQQRLPFNAAPYTSTVVFLVRSGNPKAIKDWSDLVRSDIGVITPNPKTSGGARWNYLAAWGYALQNGGDQDKAREFVKQLFERVVVLDSGARGSTQSFAEKNLGDVLVTWENEAYQSQKTYAEKGFEIVVPSVSILAEPVVSVVDRVVDEKGTRAAAEAYLNFLYTDAAQEIIAQSFYRPRNQEIAKRYENILKPVELFTLEGTFGGWSLVEKAHFADGAIFDQILSEAQ